MEEVLISYPGVTGTYPITLVVTTNEGVDSITLEVEVNRMLFLCSKYIYPDNDEHNQTWSIV